MRMRRLDRSGNLYSLGTSSLGVTDGVVHTIIIALKDLR